MKIVYFCEFKPHCIYMKRMFRRLLPFIALALMASCTTSKQILYFQDLDEVQLKPLETAYEAVIKKDDRLIILVSGPDKTVTAPYNLTLADMGERGGYSTNPEQSALSYLVDTEGNIDFPILGKIHVEGLTRAQLVNYLTAEIGKDVKDPIVYISFKNYKITVLGEVRSPGTYVMDSEKITVLQALGKAGDLSLTADRDGILLLREENGTLQHYKIDLRNSELLDSPIYYLQQNDVLVVPPSATRVASATTATSLWSLGFSSITTIIALLTFLL